ncbi:SDR family oxidoreductase [Algoriphagus aestuarii]|nr:SDR family oxidoreductase [Algoriphagus aestuarii]
MQKVLILGSTGMLGHQVFFNLDSSEDFEVFDLSFRNKLREETIIFDITDFKKFEGIIKEITPDVIINCIGILIKGSNQNPKNSILINAYFPHWLMSIADEIDSKVIHISTDCVFSGKKGGYIESDFRDADDVYGRGKALGELFSDKHLTLRTSIIGPELKQNGEGLFHWFMNQKAETNGFTRAFWGGVTTTQLSKSIKKAISEDLTGLYHVTNGIAISKFDLLNLFNKTFERGLKINAVEGKSVDKSLKSEKKDVDFVIPSYESMIEEMKVNIDKNNSIYSSIYPNEG